MFNLLIFVSLFLIISVIVYFFTRLAIDVYITLQGPFFAGSSQERIHILKKLANLKKGDSVVDLGSGDGRVLIQLARKGVALTGFEINPFLVKKSKQKVNEAGLKDKIEIKAKNFWQQDLSDYTHIIIYGIPYIMEKLEKKIRAEAKPGTVVLSVFFPITGLDQVKKVGDVRKYIIPLKK